MKFITKTILAAALGLSTISGTALANAQEIPKQTKVPTDNCTHLAWISDSTGINIHKQEKGTVNTKEKTTPITKALADTNVEKLTYDVLGGRSLKERVNNGTNGIDALESLKDDRTINCYLLTMGTNDAANVVVGSNYTAEQRIKDVLDNTNNKPIVWVVPDLGEKVTVNGYTLKGQKVFNDTLQKIAKTNPRLKLVDMKTEIEKNKGTNNLPKTHDEFFIEDGIHYTSDVSTFRSETIANTFKPKPEANYTKN